MPREENISATSEFRQRALRNGAALLSRVQAIAAPLGVPVRALGSKVAALDKATLNLGADGMSKEDRAKRRLLYRRLLLGISAVAGVSVLTGFWARPLSNLVGLLWPLYQSFKCLRTPELGDDKQWLTYWLIFGTSLVGESFFGLILDSIPFYHAIKMLFYVYCFAPQTKGAASVYSNHLEPLLLRYEEKIDREVELMGDEAKDLGSDLMERGAAGLRGTVKAVQAGGLGLGSAPGAAGGQGGGAGASLSAAAGLAGAMSGAGGSGADPVDRISRALDNVAPD